MLPTTVQIVRATAGTTLSALTGALARLRRDRALHPHGTTHQATLHRTGGSSGIRWIDTPATDAVVVRLSRGAGLPASIPDVLGLGIKHPDGDILLSTGGDGPLARHLPWPRRHPHKTTYTSVVPYRSEQGPVMLAARRERSDQLRLGYSARTRRWHQFAILTLGPAVMADHPAASARFDPVATPPGLETYPVVAALRDPAYRQSRTSSRR